MWRERYRRYMGFSGEVWKVHGVRVWRGRYRRCMEFRVWSGVRKVYGV